MSNKQRLARIGDSVDMADQIYRMEGQLEATEQRNRELEHRPTVASHNALQEECDGRLVVHKRQRACITELVETLRWLKANGVGPEGNARINALIDKMEPIDE